MSSERHATRGLHPAPLQAPARPTPRPSNFDGFIKVLGRYSFYVPCADFFQYQAGPGRLADRA